MTHGSLTASTETQTRVSWVLGSRLSLAVTDPSSFTLVSQQGELMKMRGNEEFSKQRFDLAVIFYTRAIEYR